MQLEVETCTYILYTMFWCVCGVCVGGGGEFQGTCKMSLGSEFDYKQSSAVCTYMLGLVKRHTYKL